MMQASFFSKCILRSKAICLSVCLLPMAGRTAGPIKTKLGIWTHVDPGSVLTFSQGQGQCHLSMRVHGIKNS